MKIVQLKLLFIKYWLRAVIFLLGVYLTVSLAPVVITFNNFVFNNTKLMLPAIATFLIGVLSYKISLYSLITASIIVVIFNKVYRIILIKRSKLKILKAEYGSGNLFIEITNKLNDAIEDNKLNIVLSNNIIGDPTPGIAKIGKIKYKLGNKEEEITYKEGDTINLAQR